MYSALIAALTAINLQPYLVLILSSQSTMLVYRFVSRLSINSTFKCIYMSAIVLQALCFEVVCACIHDCIPKVCECKILGGISSI